MTHRVRTCLAAVLAVVCLSTSSLAWGPQGHRLVGMVASTYLTGTARQNVSWLLGTQTLADVATWADEYLDGNNQTGPWHYVNIPRFATAYNRDRDCPRQAGVSAGGRGDQWRDCIVDRIQYNQERLADPSLDRADRAVALKFLVHFVGDLHQPFHALGVERGGNGIEVVAFGTADCSPGGMTSRPCNLHSVWDSTMIARRKLGDLQYLTVLQQLIRHKRLDREPVDSPAAWARESHALAKKALVPEYGQIDEAYYAEHIRVVDKRLALGGLRLAALLNRSLTTPRRRIDMSTRAAGKFDVKLHPQPLADASSDATLGRLSIDKQWHGDLAGASKGEMLSAVTGVKGSAGYVAIERVTATLHGRAGTFVLQHTGTMTRGEPQLSVTVVPDSGTGQLTGLTGQLAITITGSEHSYEFDYTLPA